MDISFELLLYFQRFKSQQSWPLQCSPLNSVLWGLRHFLLLFYFVFKNVEYGSLVFLAENLFLFTQNARVVSMDYDGNKRDSEQLRSPNQPHPASCQSAYCGQKIRFARPNVPLTQSLYGREPFRCHVCKIKK